MTKTQYRLAITKPEEGAGAAFDAMSELLVSLKIPYTTQEVSMDLSERVLNPEAVKDAVNFVKNNPEVIYVKGPGITPTDEQIFQTIITLEKRGNLFFKGSAATLNDNIAELRESFRPLESDEHMQDFAKKTMLLRVPFGGLGSPNAGWRDDLQANLKRGTSDKLAKNSLVQPPKWETTTPLTIAAFAPTENNRLTAIIEKPTTFTVNFEPEDKSSPTEKIGAQEVSGNTPVRISSFNEAEVKAWAKSVLGNISPQTQIAHGTKQTVLKKSDVSLIGWIQNVLDELNLATQIAPFARKKDAPDKLGALLVDDLFSRLSTTELTTPTMILSPNHSYGTYVKDVWDGIKTNGGFKITQNSEIVRASATRDHYKAIEYKAEKPGTLAIKDKDGNAILSKKLAGGDAAMVTHFDRARVKSMVGSTLKSANENGRKNILFGFDKDDPYYEIAVDELDAIKGQYPNLNIEVLDAAKATVKYLTGGAKDTTLMLNNIYGDFATDIELNGKGTSYSVGTLPDGRGVVELGSGGTAPDLITLWKETCILRFNPMSFIEGISLAITAATNKLPEGKEKNLAIATAKALEDGIYLSTNKGIVLPIVKGKFRKNPDAEYKEVSTETFLKSVELEAIRILKDQKLITDISDEKIAHMQSELNNAIATDKALFAAEKKHGQKWKELTLTWNNKREASSEIDIIKPHFSIDIPPDIKISTLNEDVLLNLQATRATS